jgi:hypothetical protein
MAATAALRKRSRQLAIQQKKESTMANVNIYRHCERHRRAAIYLKILIIMDCHGVN